MEEEDIVTTAAAATAVTLPLDISRRSIDYLRNYDPGIIYKNNYEIKDLKQLLNIYDDLVSFLKINPQEFDKKIIDDLLGGIGVLGNTHFDVAERTEDFLTDIFVEKNPLDAEKNIGKALTNLIELEEDISGTVRRIADSGVDAHGLSLFEQANGGLTNAIDQSIDELKKLSKQPNATPLDIAKQLQDGKFSNIVGAQQQVFDIGRTLIGHMTWAKVGTITRGVVVETALYTDILNVLTNLPKEQIAAIDKLTQEVKPGFRNIEDLENIPVTRNKTMTMNTLKSMQDNMKEFLNTRYNSYLKRDADFFWRINQKKKKKEERAIFAMGDYMRTLSTVVRDEKKKKIFLPQKYDYAANIPVNEYMDKKFDVGYEPKVLPDGVLRQIPMEFADDATLLKAPDISLNKVGRFHMTPAANIASIANKVGVDMLVYSKRKGGLVPLSVINLVDTSDTLEMWKAPGTTDEDVTKLVNALVDKPLDNQNFRLTVELPEAEPVAKKPTLQQARNLFINTHGQEAIKKADEITKTKPKFASKVLNNLSKLDVGQEVIEKGLAKLGTKYGAASVTGPAAAALAFYETLVLAADVANAATKAIDKDVDFFDNFGKIDDKYSITYKLTKPFYDTLFKGLRGITSDNKD